MTVPLGDLALLAAFGAIAVWYRKRPEIHKRAMLLAGIGCMVPPAASRLPLGDGTAAMVLAFVLLLAACLVHDYYERGRLHPLNLWGSVAILASRTGARRARADGRVALICGMDDALGRAPRAGGYRRIEPTEPLAGDAQPAPVEPVDPLAAGPLDLDQARALELAQMPRRRRPRAREPIRDLARRHAIAAKVQDQ